MTHPEVTAQLEHVVLLPALARKLTDDPSRPQLAALAATCRQMLDLVRSLATELNLQGTDGSALSGLPACSSFPHCSRIHYSCDPCSPEQVEGLVAALGTAGSGRGLQELQLQLTHPLVGGPPYSLAPALSALVHCSANLTILCITSTGQQAGLQDQDICLLGKLRGLQQLTLRFPVPFPGSTPRLLDMSPLSSLASLQQLVVEGLAPAGRGSSGGGGGGGDGVNSRRRSRSSSTDRRQERQEGSGGALQLPASVTSVTLCSQGHCAMLPHWGPVLAAAAELQQLHLVDPAEWELNAEEAGEGLGALQQLHQLHLRYSPFRSKLAPERVHCLWHELPLCVSRLTALEVLAVGTDAPQQPCEQHWLQADSLLAVLPHLPQLQQLGAVADVPAAGEQLAAVPQLLGQLTRLQVDVDEELPEWLGPSTCPKLCHLEMSGAAMSSSLLGSLALELTGLTCLRLDTGYATVAYVAEPSGWGGLEVLSRLPVLWRLELVNYYRSAPDPGSNADDGESEERIALAAPGQLATVTQLRQLQITYYWAGEHVAPVEPLAMPWELRKLTQLEQLELVGYSEVSASTLQQQVLPSLPALRVLRVGYRPRRGTCWDASAARNAVRQKQKREWEELRQACSRQRPPLRLDAFEYRGLW